MFQEKTIVRFWSWALPTLLVVAVFVLIMVFAFHIADVLDKGEPVRTTANGGAFVRGSATAAWCDVHIVELEGHKYVVAVSTRGCAICPAVDDSEKGGK